MMNYTKRSKPLDDLLPFITISIVDDSRNIRDGIELRLKREGYKSIFKSAKCEDALENKQLSTTDILLTDYVFVGSEMQGLEFIGKVKQEYGDNIEIILMSSEVKEEEKREMRAQAIERGAVTFFDKSFLDSELNFEYLRLWINELGKRIWLQRIIDQVPNEIAVLDFNKTGEKVGNILYMNNKKIEEFKKYKPELSDYYGKKCYEVFENKVKVCNDCPSQKAFDDNEVIKTEWRYKPNRASEYTVDLVAASLRDKQDTSRAIIEIVRDITKRKIVEKIIDEMEKADRLEDRKRIFMDGFNKLGIPRARLYLSFEKLGRKFYRMVDKRGDYNPPLLIPVDLDLKDDKPTKEIIAQKNPIIFRRDKINDGRDYEPDLTIQNMFWVGKNNIYQYEILPKDEWIDYAVPQKLDKKIG